MLVRDLMTPDPVTVEAGAPLKRAVALMRREALYELPVMEDGQLVGVLTDRDVVTALGASVRDERLEIGEPARLDAPVSEHMTAPVQALHLDHGADDACAMLVGLGLRAAPVIDSDRRLQGVLSASDLLHAAAPLFARDE